MPYIFYILICKISKIIKYINKILRLYKFNFHPKFLYDSDGWFRKIVLILATYSYGMYLVHRALLALFNTYFRHELSYGPLVIVTFLLTFFTTWAIMAICNRIPYLNELIGVK